jgi:uncharacterized damage-inducible protein DinB
MSEKESQSPPTPEPWLRGTLTQFPAAPRGVLHALELAKEDVERWCADLTEQELLSRPAGLPSVAFQLRHIARSLDRLLNYAEGRPLDEMQMAALNAEHDSEVSREAIFGEIAAALDTSAERIRALANLDFEQPRYVGKKKLPTTLGGLLVHVAEHTQRHVGQAITTAKIVIAQRD